MRSSVAPTYSGNFKIDIQPSTLNGFPRSSLWEAFYQWSYRCHAASMAPAKAPRCRKRKEERRTGRLGDTGNMTINKTFIAGAWVESNDTIRNINPSNTDCYGPREQGRYAAEFHTTVKTSYILS
jgi:hypothetical protein